MKFTPTTIVMFLLALMLFIEVTTSLQESQVIDEGVHLSAGLSYWKTGDWRMNPEHPPLMKLLAAAPLIFTSARVPVEHWSWTAFNEWEFGDVFMYNNTLDPQTLLFLGRIPIMLLSILLGWWIFNAARGWFGAWAGVFSLALFALDPNIITHSRYVTTDLGFSAFAFWSIYRLNILMQHPTRLNGVMFGLALLAAGLAKFSGIAFIPIVVTVVILLKLRERQHPALLGWRLRKWLLVAFPIMALMTWALYGFDIRKPADDPRIVQLYSEREELLRTTDSSTLPPLERFAVEQLGDRVTTIGAQLEQWSHRPIPGYAFFRGLFAVIGHSVGGQEAYLLGQTSDKGWWYYFPLAFLAKTPLPTFVAIIAVFMLFGSQLWRSQFFTRSWRATFRTLDRRWILYGLPPLAWMGFSMVSNLNLGWRHIMPMYPFLFVLAGSLTTLALPSRRWGRWLIPLVLVVNLGFIQATTYPNEMGHFSPLVGGAINGPRILIDSNLDWGQDLPKLKRFVHDNDIRTLPFAYYGRANVSSYLPQATPLPTTEEVERSGLPPGVVAISVGQLFRNDGEYRWLWQYQPTKKIGSSIYLYSLPSSSMALPRPGF